MTTPIPWSDLPARRAALWLADHPTGETSVFVRRSRAEVHLHRHTEHDARRTAVELGFAADDYHETTRTPRGPVFRTWGTGGPLHLIWWGTP